MMNLCATGPRTLTPEQTSAVSIITNGYISSARLQSKSNFELHVGDAKGVDYIASKVGRELGVPTKVHIVSKKYIKAGYARRSMEMVDNCLGGIILGFPNKICPEEVTPNNAFCGSGSGTWGTLAYAKKKGLKLLIFPLFEEIELPTWVG